MSVAVCNVNTEFAANRAASRAWRQIAEQAGPPPLVLTPSSQANGYTFAGDDSFAALYESGGIRAEFEIGDDFHVPNACALEVSADWLDRRLEDLGYAPASDDAGAPETPAPFALLPAAPRMPFRAAASGHPLRSMMRELAPAPETDAPIGTADEITQTEKGLTHRRRGLKKVAATFKAALMSFLALQLMTETAAGEEDRDTGWLEDVSGATVGTAILVPILTTEAIDHAFATVTVMVTPEDVRPVAVEDNWPFGDDFTVYTPAAQADLTGDGAALETDDLLPAETNILDDTGDEADQREPVNRPGTGGDVADPASIADLPAVPGLEDLLHPTATPELV